VTPYQGRILRSTHPAASLTADGYLVVRHGKGDKDRVVPLKPERVQELAHYLAAVRPALARRDSPPMM
jgi:site-specific recombinase XerD